MRSLSGLILLPLLLWVSGPVSADELRCNGIDGGCCTKENPCKEGDGDCDNDDECEEGLFCADNICPWGDGDDCCKKEKPGSCYYDWPGRLLPKHVKSSSNMEPALCQLLCKVGKFDYAGLQNGKECWCGSGKPPGGRKLDPKDCDKPCQGDKSVMCGGGYKMNIYEAYSELRCNGKDGGCCTEENPCKEGDGDCDNDDQCEGGLFCADNGCPWGDGDGCCKKEKPGNCYYDRPRLLEKHLKSSDKMEPKLCREMCGVRKFNYAGVQNGRECWCGIEPPSWEKKLDPKDCDKPCEGDESIMCGGGYKMNIYEAYDHTEVIKKYKDAYLGLQNDAESAEEYFEKVAELLPVLLNANALEEDEIGVAYEVNHPGKYPLALLTGEDIITARVPRQTITINGTVTKKIGKRYFTRAKYRPTGLYAKPGDMVTVTIPQDLVGKLKAQIGQDDERMVEVELKKSTQKMGSPMGGLIIIYIKDIDATTEKGQFNVQVENAIQAPIFVYGQNTNDEWNNVIKKNAAPWTVLRIPGQLIIYIKTERVNTVTDIEKVLKDWKETFDIGDDLLGIPPNIQPGEERIHFNPVNWAPGWRAGVCTGGGTSSLGDYAAPELIKDNCPVAYHEMGHGYCYDDLPGNIGGEQWTAELVREYIERKKNLPMVSREAKKSTPFNVLYRMVSFSKFSQGKPCDGLTEFKKPSYPLNSYDNCWDYLYRIPLYEFGWDVLRTVFRTDATDTTEYDSKTDRMADLYCKATQSNLVPLFNFYNIKLSKEISARCAQLKPTTMITQYIDIANCIKNKDIKICAKLPGFPSHKGICTISGVCNKNPDTQTTVHMNNEYDLWGGTCDASYKSGYRNTGQVKENCLGRAKEVFEWCSNSRDQNITVTFSSKDGDSKASFPFQGNCYNDYHRLLPKYLGSSSEQVPQRCRRKCGEENYVYSGVQNHDECWCGNSPPPFKKQVQQKECGRACSGDKSLMCGGGYRMNILKV